MRLVVVCVAGVAVAVAIAVVGVCVKGFDCIMQIWALWGNPAAI